MSKPRWRLSEKSLEADRTVNDADGVSQREAPGSWELVETSWLQKQLGLLPIPIVECGGTSESGEFPGLIARRISVDPGIVAIGFGIEPQHVLALTNPIVFGRLRPEDVTDGIAQLLDLATRVACRERCQWIRVLLSDSLSEHESSCDMLRKALLSKGFSCLAQISEWHRTYSREERLLDPDLQFSNSCELLTIDQLRDVDLRCEVTRLLEDVLAVSSDLPNLPQPSASEKLSHWLGERSEILICRTDSVPAGICVVEASSPKDGTLPVVIKYVGVAPSLRQQRIASRLIRWMVTHSLEDHRSVGMMVTADQSNVAALRLYESLGFQRQSSHDVWMKRTDVGLGQTDIR